MGLLNPMMKNIQTSLMSFGLAAIDFQFQPLISFVLEDTDTIRSAFLAPLEVLLCSDQFPKEALPESHFTSHCAGISNLDSLK